MWTSCLSVDLGDGTLKKHAELLTGRTWHGACLLQNKIFVAGGHNNELQTVENGEYYDLVKNKWVEFFQYMDDYVENITLVETDYMHLVARIAHAQSCATCYESSPFRILV